MHIFDCTLLQVDFHKTPLYLPTFSAEIKAKTDWLLYHYKFYTMEFMLEGFPLNYGLSLWVILLAFLCGGCEFLLRRFLIPRTTYMEKKKRSGLIAIVYALWIIVVSFIIPDNIHSFIIHGNGWAILAIMALLAALVNYANNYYWDKCSEKYNWQ